MGLTVELRVDVSGMPHSFLVLTGPDGIERGYGLAPRQPNSPAAFGIIQEDTQHEYSDTTGPIPLTTEEYNRLVGYITKSIENPPPYDVFFGSQCANWVVKGLVEAGIPALASPNLFPDNFLRDLFETIVWNPYTQWLNIQINDAYLAARSFVRRDPLALDLDGDGIETVGATGNGTTLFDYNNDGIRTGTGWVGPDDALVVMDRNGNGTIDHGGELFGVDTIMADGTQAADGFAALADLDGNGDGLFNAADAAYTQVRLWQDANQDGISQSAELKPLSEQGIAAIHLTAAASGQLLANGNQIAYTGTYDKTTGGTGGAYALNLADNPFYRQYPDGSVVSETNPFAQQNAPIPLTAEAQNLPDMQGAGAVRDLREAASLDAVLAQDILAQIDAGWQSRQALWSQMDGLLERWADTSEFATSAELAQANGMELHYGPWATYSQRILKAHRQHDFQTTERIAA